MIIELDKSEIETIISWAEVREVEWNLDHREKTIVAYLRRCLKKEIEQ